MKKLLLFSLLLTFLMIGVAQADEQSLDLSDNLSTVISKLPNVDNGGYYSLLDSRFNYSATIKLVGTKDGKFALNFGYAGRAKESRDKIIVTISGKLAQLKDYVDLPVLDLIVFDPYICAGYGGINSQALGDSEFDIGVGANILKVSW